MSRIEHKYKYYAIGNSSKRVVSKIYTLDDLESYSKDKIWDFAESLAENITTYRKRFTGLYDTNKIEIYEGDYMLDGHSGNLGEVKYIKGAFVVEFDGEYQDLYDWTCECVIGNIYENPDMLECT